MHRGIKEGRLLKAHWLLDSGHQEPFKEDFQLVVEVEIRWCNRSGREGVKREHYIFKGH